MASDRRSNTPATGHAAEPVEAVVFDLDGLLLDSETIWEEVRRQFVAENGGQWHADTQSKLMGMSTKEWAAYLHEDLRVEMPPESIVTAVVGEMEDSYERRLPLIDGAPAAVKLLAARWPLGIASSSPRRLVDFVLECAHLSESFTVTVSSDEVDRGKPAPDVYIEAARRLGVPPNRCAAVEDSGNGLRSAAAARMRVVAIPNRHYAPSTDAVTLASIVLANLHELTVECVESLR
jgi:HAD superfamily hydrolase (TIGR01509 family)